MSTQNDYSDEVINAFVDNELSEQERMELLRDASDSDELRSRICEISYLKSQVVAAYPAPPGPAASGVVSGRRAFLAYASAAAVGGLSVFTLQWLGTDQAQRRDRLALNDAAGPGTSMTRVLFHISTDQQRVGGELLDQVELVLGEYAGNDKPLRVEVVANNQGLRFLQRGRTPFAERIGRLDGRYQNLLFAACGNTLQRLRREHDEQIEILPGAVIVQSGVSFVARRQLEGWAYIKV